MTKKSTAISCLVLFVAGVLTSWFYHFRAKEIRDTEVCSTTVVTYHNNIRANLTLDFMYTLKKRTGIIAVNGTYSKNDKVIGAIRRDVSYVWTENKDSFQFSSVKVNKVITDESVSDEEISEVLPVFYVYPGKSITYTILPQGSHGFMFAIGKRPIFFCSR